MRFFRDMDLDEEVLSPFRRRIIDIAPRGAVDGPAGNTGIVPPGPYGGGITITPNPAPSSAPVASGPTVYNPYAPQPSALPSYLLPATTVPTAPAVSPAPAPAPSNFSFMGVDDLQDALDFGEIDPSLLVGPQAVPAAPQASGGGFFSNLLTGLTKAGGWFERNSNNVVQVLDAYGRTRNKAALAQRNVGLAWDMNVRQTPRMNWFSEETLIPGVSNGLVAGGALGAVLLVVMLKRKGQAGGH